MLRAKQKDRQAAVALTRLVRTAAGRRRYTVETGKTWVGTRFGNNEGGNWGRAAVWILNRGIRRQASRMARGVSLNVIRKKLSVGSGQIRSRGQPLICKKGSGGGGSSP